MTKGLMMNHNAMRGGLDLTDASRSLASGNASLKGAASSLTDVRALLPEDLDDENEGEEADNEEEKDKEEGAKAKGQDEVVRSGSGLEQGEQADAKRFG